MFSCTVYKKFAHCVKVPFEPLNINRESVYCAAFRMILQYESLLQDCKVKVVLSVYVPPIVFVIVKTGYVPKS